MGLDGVELLMAVEEEFEITIGDDEAGSVYTVGDLVELVYQKVRSRNTSPCLSQAAFYRIRRQLLHHPDFGSPERAALTPKTPLAALMPRSERRRLWPQLLAMVTGSETQVPWLKLCLLHKERRPPGWVLPLSGVALILLILPVELWLFGLLLLATTFWLAEWLLTPFEHTFPDGYTTLGDLTKLLSSTSTREWNRTDIFTEVRRIGAEQLAIDPERIHLHSKWIDDLGLD